MDTEERNELVGKLRNLADIKHSYYLKNLYRQDLEKILEDNNVEKNWYESFINDDYDKYVDWGTTALIKARENYCDIKSELYYLSYKEPKSKQKSRPDISIWFNVLFIIFAIFDLIFFSVAYSVGNKMATNYQQISLQNQPALSIIAEIENVNMDNPVTEYDKWVALWRVDNMTWEELCDNWEPVENSWKDLGIDIDLNFLENVIHKVFSRPRTYNEFAEVFKTRIRSTYYHSPGDNGHTQFIVGHIFLGIFLLNVAILSLYYLIKWLRVASYNKSVKYYNKNQLKIDIENHNNELERLQNEINNIVSKLPSLIKESINVCEREYLDYKAECKRLEQELNSSKYDFFHIRDYSTSKLKYMADLLEKGRADSYKEALNIYMDKYGK